MPAVDPELLVFGIEEQRYALHLHAVSRVLPMMHVEPLPGGPAPVDGIINVAGLIVPVMNLRRRFRWAEREARLTDVLILAHANGLQVALPADHVVGVLVPSRQDVAPVAAAVPDTPHLAGVVKLDDGLVLIHDIDLFLSAHEQQELRQALDDAEGAG